MRPGAGAEAVEHQRQRAPGQNDAQAPAEAEQQRDGERVAPGAVGKELRGQRADGGKGQRPEHPREDAPERPPPERRVPSRGQQSERGGHKPEGKQARRADARDQHHGQHSSGDIARRVRRVEPARLCIAPAQFAFHRGQQQPIGEAREPVGDGHAQAEAQQDQPLPRRRAHASGVPAGRRGCAVLMSVMASVRCAAPRYRHGKGYVHRWPEASFLVPECAGAA